MAWRWGRWAIAILGGRRRAAGALLLAVATAFPCSQVAADDRAALGLVISHLTPESAPVFAVPDGKGALVVGVAPGGSAAGAGILPGDVLRIIAGRIVSDPAAVVATARSLTVGAKVQVVVRRAGADRKMTLVVGDVATLDTGPAALLVERYQQAAVAFEASDPARAVPIARELAMRGHGPAQNLYAVMISIGQAENGDPAAASFWFRLAAQQNESAAQNNLALQYWQGAGVPRDNARAYFWASQAAAAGNSGAAELQQQIAATLQPAELAAADSWLAWVPAAAPPEAVATPAPPGPSREEVRQAQQHLARLGYDVGIADGVAGRKTKAAIRAFQEQSALTVDGAVTPALLAALAAAPTPAASPSATAPAATPAPEQGLGDLGFPSGDLEIDE